MSESSAPRKRDRIRNHLRLPIRPRDQDAASQVSAAFPPQEGPSVDATAVTATPSQRFLDSALDRLSVDERTLSMSHRLEAYFDYYQRLPAMLATDNFEKALIETYACVLRFIAKAIQVYASSVTSRTWHALWETSSLERFETECDTLGTRTEIEASNCNRELIARDRSDAKR